ncbi:MAG: helix-turn-helix domain-containing protein [Verrucomicrobia bacterium]|nr:helix-turn-helix domain-containing protein [Verrucomicrobiota bacterium]
MCAASRPADRPAVPPRVEQRGPFGPLGHRREHRLQPGDIHPVVRIAHRLPGNLNIPERIIFDHELVLIAKGRGEWVLGGVRRPYAMHDLLFIPPFSPHTIVADETAPSEHIAVHFDLAAGIPPASQGLDRRRPYRVTFTHGLEIATQRRLFAGHRLARLLHQVVATHASGHVTGPARSAVHLAEVLLELLAESRGARPGDPGQRDRARVQAIVRHMTENLARPVDHPALERFSGLSPSRLQALFRAVTGHPPLDYLRRLRVEEARRLLADRRLSVKEVGARTGFRDTSHFSKVFRRVDGLSPAHYRDALLAGRQEK